MGPVARCESIPAIGVIPIPALANTIGRPESGMRHIVNDDAGTLPRRLENNRLTNPAVAAGDNGNFVF
jgi:hypothetical protein